jgi:hypothetical protein
MAVTNKSVAASDGAEQTCVLPATTTTTAGMHDGTGFFPLACGDSGILTVTNKSMAAFDGPEQTCVVPATTTTTAVMHDGTSSMSQRYAASPFDPMVVGLVRLALYMLTARRCLSFLLP